MITGEETIQYFEKLIGDGSINKTRKFIKVGNIFEEIPIKAKFVSEPRDYLKKIRGPSIESLVFEFIEKAKKHYIINESGEDQVYQEINKIPQETGRYILAINETPFYTIEIEENGLVIPKMKFQLIPLFTPKAKQELLKYSLEEDLQTINLEYVGSKNSSLSKLHTKILKESKRFIPLPVE